MGVRSIVVLATAVLWAGPVAAQETSGPSLGLGFAMGSPGRDVTVPFSLEGVAGPSVGRIVATVTFRGDVVTFVRLEPAGLLGDTVETKATLREPVKDAKTPERVLEILITATRQASALADGIMGYLVFQIDPKADVDATSEVELVVESKIFAQETKDDDPPLAVASGSGRILLEHADLPIIACYFYMH